MSKEPERTSHIFHIQDLKESGEGLTCQLGLGAIPIRYTLPGDEVRVTEVVYKKHRRFYLEEILKASPQRTEPVCIHFTQCGGCALQHFDAPTYAKFKKGLVIQALEQEGLEYEMVEEAVIVGPGKRRRINMDFSKKNDTVFLGFHRAQSHQIVNLTECHTVTPTLANLIVPLREMLSCILENGAKGRVFLLHADNGVDISLEIQGIKIPSSAIKDAMLTFGKVHALARFFYRMGKQTHDVYVNQKPYVTFGTHRIPIDAYSFLQSSSESEALLVRLVTEAFSPKIKRIADLFCGRGTFALPLSETYTVDGFELDPQAYATLSGMDVVSLRVHQRNLFDMPLLSQDLNMYDAVVIDPPRAGAESQCHQLAASNVSQIIYVSCGAASFARDTKILQEGSYVLKKVTPVDQFMWSPHIELVGVFEKNI